MTPTDTNFLNRDIPNMARIFDYLAGGTAHYAADRKTAVHLLTIVPSLRKWVRLRRAFIQEAAQQLHGEGFRQFLDLASGIPASDHIHAFLPDSRIVYSDINPVAASYGHGLFADRDNISFLQADARRLHELVAHPEARRLLDRREKIAIGLNALPIFLPLDDCHQLVEDLYQWAPVGSKLFVVLQSRAAFTASNGYAEVQELSEAAGMRMYIHALDTTRALLRPWTFTLLEPITNYLGLPPDFITPDDRTEIRLMFHAAILEKPTAVSH